MIDLNFAPFSLNLHQLTITVSDVGIYPTDSPSQIAGDQTKIKEITGKIQDIIDKK